MATEIGEVSEERGRVKGHGTRVCKELRLSEFPLATVGHSQEAVAKSNPRIVLPSF